MTSLPPLSSFKQPVSSHVTMLTATVTKTDPQLINMWTTGLLWTTRRLAVPTRRYMSDPSARLRAAAPTRFSPSLLTAEGSASSQTLMTQGNASSRFVVARAFRVKRGRHSALIASCVPPTLHCPYAPGAPEVNTEQKCHRTLWVIA